MKEKLALSCGGVKEEVVHNLSKSLPQNFELSSTEAYMLKHASSNLSFPVFQGKMREKCLPLSKSPRGENTLIVLRADVDVAVQNLQLVQPTNYISCNYFLLYTASLKGQTVKFQHRIYFKFRS